MFKLPAGDDSPRHYHGSTTVCPLLQRSEPRPRGGYQTHMPLPTKDARSRPTFWSLVPAYEIFVATVLPSDNVWMAVLGLATSIIAQGCTWIVSERLVHSVYINLFFFRNPSNKDGKMASGNALRYALCLEREWLTQRYSMVSNLYGTSFFLHMLWFWGSTMEREENSTTTNLWYFGDRVYEQSLLKFGDRTIMDNAHASGHYAIHNRVILRKAYVQGILHPHTYSCLLYTYPSPRDLSTSRMPSSA